jgi:signal peptidase II
MLVNYLIFIGVLLTDQLTKWWAIRHCEQQQVIRSWLSCSLSYNRGFSWSMFHTEDSFMFCLVSLVIVTVIGIFAYYTYALYKENQLLYGPALVLAGAIGNFIDRLIHGGVVDFIIIHYGDWSWPIFNVADVAICVGVGLLLLLYREPARGAV